MQETCGINSEPEGKNFAAFNDHLLIRHSLWTLSSLLQATKSYISGVAVQTLLDVLVQTALHVSQ